MDESPKQPRQSDQQQQQQQQDDTFIKEFNAAKEHWSYKVSLLKRQLRSAQLDRQEAESRADEALKRLEPLDILKKQLQEQVMSLQEEVKELKEGNEERKHAMFNEGQAREYQARIYELEGKLQEYRSSKHSLQAALDASRRENQQLKSKLYRAIGWIPPDGQ